MSLSFELPALVAMAYEDNFYEELLAWMQNALHTHDLQRKPTRDEWRKIFALGSDELKASETYAHQLGLNYRLPCPELSRDPEHYMFTDDPDLPADSRSKFVRKGCTWLMHKVQTEPRTYELMTWRRSESSSDAEAEAEAHRVTSSTTDDRIIGKVTGTFRRLFERDGRPMNLKD